MLHGRLVSDDYSNEEPKLLYEIEEFARNNNMRRISPYYHIINEIDEMTWVDVKVKVLEVSIHNGYSTCHNRVWFVLSSAFYICNAFGRFQSIANNNIYYSAHFIFNTCDSYKRRKV